MAALRAERDWVSRGRLRSLLDHRLSLRVSTTAATSVTVTVGAGGANCEVGETDGVTCAVH